MTKAIGTGPGTAIGHIVSRAANIARQAGIPFSKFTAAEILRDVHLNACPLRLTALARRRTSLDRDLAHDVFGILRHYDHETGKLRDHFRPRYAART